MEVIKEVEVVKEVPVETIKEVPVENSDQLKELQDQLNSLQLALANVLPPTPPEPTEPTETGANTST